MIDMVEIKKLPRSEKLMLMESIWEDLAGNVESPAWHKKVLAETEYRLSEGKEKILDWDQAKDDIRKRA